MKPEVREIEVEVLPKGEPGRSKFDDPFIEFVARLMDSIFTIPGTKIRFGLDPIIGLLPGVGSPLSALVSLYLIIRSAQHRVPPIVLARMGLNVLINAALDAVPVAGDALSIFYRSNAQNYELLRKHAGKPGQSTRGHWLFVGGLIGGMAILLIFFITVEIALVLQLLSLVSHWFGGAA